jgi:anti-anti-sigma regulatory factor
MLRIHKLENGEVILVLSGRLDAGHIGELEALVRAESSGRAVFLDLKDMTLAGREGIELLARCEAAGIGLLNCARYVREWITRHRKDANYCGST